MNGVPVNIFAHEDETKQVLKIDGLYYKAAVEQAVQQFCPGFEVVYDQIWEKTIIVNKIHVDGLRVHLALNNIGSKEITE